MKLHAFLAVVISICLLFCGCAAKTADPTPVTSGFSADVQIDYDDNVFKGTLTFKNTNDFEVVFSYPEIISGLKIVYNAGEATVNYNGLDYSGMYDFSAVNLLSDALKELETNPIPSDEGEYDYGQYEVKVNNKGYVTEIDFNDIDLEIYLSNQKLITTE